QFGSLINPIELPYEEWMNRINKLENRQNDLIEESYSHELVEKLLPVLKQAYLLYQKYDVVVTNPPYHNKYNPVLKKFMNKEYNDYKTDLYSAFIYKTSLMSKENGYSALMTPYTWMYITSHEKLRETIIENLTISSLVELEYSAFKEATVPICSFILHNQNNQQLGEFVKLSNFKGAELQPIKVSEAVFNRNVNYRYSKNTGDFGKIPMSPISYFASEKVINIFKTHIKIKDIAEIKKGLDTGGNDAVIRKWYEVVFDKINMQASNIKEFDNSNATFVPFNKGGDYRKWYGNRENVVGYNKNFRKIMSTFKGHRHQNRDYYFREALTFSAISSTNLGVRYTPKGSLFGAGGSNLFVDNGRQLIEVLAILCSKVSKYFLDTLNPTLNINISDIERIPYVTDPYITKYAEECIQVLQQDWDYYETSWDFTLHPFIKLATQSTKLDDVFNIWWEKVENRYHILKEKEELINKIFFDLMELNSELSPEIEDKDVTISKASKKDDARSLLSYFIG